MHLRSFRSSRISLNPAAVAAGTSSSQPITLPSSCVMFRISSFSLMVKTHSRPKGSYSP